MAVSLEFLDLDEIYFDCAGGRTILNGVVVEDLVVGRVNKASPPFLMLQVRITHGCGCPMHATMNHEYERIDPRAV
jgi:hypothetical protein